MPTDTFMKLPQEKKDKIIVAAKKEFARAPIAEVSIKNIVNDAEIARGSFYQYFESKQDLLIYIIKHQASNIKEEMEKALKRNKGDIFETFIVLYDHMANRCVDEQDGQLYRKIFENIKVGEENLFVPEFPEQKEAEFGEEPLRELERVITLKIVDQKWMDHIDDMDELKNGIGLRAYGQKDPVVQYRVEGSEMFEEMIYGIKVDVVKFLMNARKREGTIHREETVKITGAGLEDAAINLVDGNYKPSEGGMNKTIVNEEPKVGRNDPCPCGSGKKYKNCCGKYQ